MQRVKTPIVSVGKQPVPSDLTGQPIPPAAADVRKAQGYAVGVAPASADGFVVTAGDDLIREYESSPAKKRAFCALCGPPLYSRRDDKPEALPIRLGSLDDPPESLVVDAHTYTDGAPAWAGPDNAPRYPGLEPGRT